MVSEQALHKGLLRLHHGSLRRSIPLGLKSVSKENIANYVRRCRNYMFAYLEGSAIGQELEEKIKFYKSASYSSHKRVGIND